MTYEIPQQLEYKEKIIFGLTFEQLAWAFLFFPIALIILFKTHWNGTVKMVLALLLGSTAMLLMFFNLKRWMKDWLAFAKFRKSNYYDDSILKFLEVKRVADSTLFTKQKKVAILQVQPVNFAIKTHKEQELLIDGFRKFLNSLDFPIQILMDTVPLRLFEHFDVVESHIRPEHEGYFAEYKKHLTELVSGKKIMNRNFYVVIPQKDDLGIQVNLCVKRLEDLNLIVKRLDDDSLRDVVAKFFEGDRITFCPVTVENKVNELVLNKTLNRVIVAAGYPRLVEAGFLDRIVTTEGDFDLSIHVQPFSIESMMVMLNKELQKQRADLYALQLKNIINPSLEIQYNDTRLILESLQKGNEKLFNISLYINCRAESDEKLNLLQRKVESELNSVMIVPRVPLFRMVQGLKSVAPLAQDELGHTKNITSTALSAFFPFTSPFLSIDETGIFLGLNKTNVPVIRDVFKLSNFNGTILASSGSGKSYFTKLMIARHVLNNTKVIIIDPQSEYRKLVKKFGGEVVSLNRTSSTMINPLDLMDHDYAEKRLSLMDLMQVMLGELSEPQKSFIDKALTMTYEKRGINNDSKTWGNLPPRLTELLESLQVLERTSNTMEKTIVRSLINRLSMYVDGVFSFLNQKTHISFNKNVVSFDIGDMPKQVKPVIMFLILDFVYMKMKRDIQRKILIVDEAWSLLERAEDAYYIFEIVKTCRKFNMGLLLINQEVEGLLGSKAGKSVLANSAYTLLMRQKPSVIKMVAETFDLSPAETNYLLTASVGEGILIMENEHAELSIISSPQEHEIITTNADEILKFEAKDKLANEPTNKSKDVKIEVDEDEGYFISDKVKPEERIYLLSKKYKEYLMTGLSGKKQKYLLRPGYHEAPEHFFLVKEVEQLLKQKGVKSTLFVTSKPDIVFEIAEKKIGIEIETGKVHPKNLKNKVALLKKSYSEWFFVVSDKNYVSKYKKFGECYDRRNVAKKIEKMLNSVRS